MSYKIKTYRDGFISWTSQVTEKTMFTPPNMTLDRPSGLKKPRPSPVEIEWDRGYFKAFTRGGSIRRARRFVRRQQKDTVRQAEATLEVIE